MKNEKTTNQLEQLNSENPNLLLNQTQLEQIIADPDQALTTINNLLEIINNQSAQIQQQKSTIDNYQAQTQATYHKISRRSSQISLQETPTFPDITPRRGSSPNNYNLLSPAFPSPLAPYSSPSLNSSPSPSHLTFSPTLPNFQDIGDNQEILIKDLEIEAKESNDDFFQECGKSSQLNELLNEERLSRQKLEQKLLREVEENLRLKTSQDQINLTLLAKIDELNQIKKLGQEEKEQFQKIITEQEQKYKEEKIQREQAFHQTLNNLRTFQTDTIPLTRHHSYGHKSTLSTSSLPVSQNNSPRTSTYGKNEERKVDTSLFLELAQTTKQSGESKGGFFKNEMVSSPTTESVINPTEQVSKRESKRHSNSPLFNYLPAMEDNSNTDEIVQELFKDINNFEIETTEKINQLSKQELLVENEELRTNQLQLEKA
ncbi:19814_t:CDS:2 [Entrophospora sp. SA101]|nr:14680_t:CDS:2 [Entrophospora sp. SA101]CAJ0747288.1 19814_t:CDS:2 [Entrophospora sp. SA101]CAJ0832396.1 10196_t:CDS:2 [Entrophospora sp. SA101]CAJ0890724.1 2750_t:CDS:2 [Entrophospora sp. SA101]